MRNRIIIALMICSVIGSVYAIDKTAFENALKNGHGSLKINSANDWDRIPEYYLQIGNERVPAIRVGTSSFYTVIDGTAYAYKSSNEISETYISTQPVNSPLRVVNQDASSFVTVMPRDNQRWIQGSLTTTLNGYKMTDNLGSVIMSAENGMVQENPLTIPPAFRETFGEKIFASTFSTDGTYSRSVTVIDDSTIKIEITDGALKTVKTYKFANGEYSIRQTDACYDPAKDCPYTVSSTVDPYSTPAGREASASALTQYEVEQKIEKILADAKDAEYRTASSAGYDELSRESMTRDVISYRTEVSTFKSKYNSVTNIGVSDNGATIWTSKGYFDVSVNNGKTEYSFTVKDKNGKDVVIRIDDAFVGYSYDRNPPTEKCTNGRCDYFAGDIPITKSEYDLMKDPKIMMKEAMNLYRIQNNKEWDPIANARSQYFSVMENKGRAKITAILSAYLDEILGPFSQGVPAALCGDNLYKKKTEDRKEFGWPFDIPHSTYASETERKVWDELRTVQVSGEVEELTSSMYRYEVNLKLIGDKAAPKWRLYLYNSCDATSLNNRTLDTGSVNYMGVFVMQYAGQSGEDMIFECGVDPFCRYDQACVKMSDEPNPRCFALAGGKC
jgi:hypothetical protein